MSNLERAAEVIADALRPALSTADGIGQDLARALAERNLLAPETTHHTLDLPTHTAHSALGVRWRYDQPADDEDSWVGVRPHPDEDDSIIIDNQGDPILMADRDAAMQLVSAILTVFAEKEQP